MAELARVLGGLGAAFKNQAPQYQQQIMQEDIFNQRMQDAELARADAQFARDEKRKATMFKDAFAANSLLAQGDIQGAISIYQDRNNQLSAAGIDNSHSRNRLNILNNAALGDANSLAQAKNVLSGDVEIGQAFGVLETPTSYIGLTDAERLEFNIPEGQAARMNTKTGKPETMGGGGSTVNVNSGNNNDVMNDVRKAFLPNPKTIQERRNAIDRFGQIETLSNAFNTKDRSFFERVLTQAFPDIAVATDDTGTLALGQAIRTKLAPTMREVGSGSTSDMEFKAYLNSLPSIIQGERGRELVAFMFKPSADRAKMLNDLDYEFASGKIDVDQFFERKKEIESQPLFDDKFKREINRIATADGGGAVFILPDVDERFAGLKAAGFDEVKD